LTLPGKNDDAGHRSVNLYREISQAAENPGLREALEARAFIAKNKRSIGASG
jgi:hypothetical protein